VDQMLDMVVCPSSLIKQQKKIKKIYLYSKVIFNLIFIFVLFLFKIAAKKPKLINIFFVINNGMQV